MSIAINSNFERDQYVASFNGQTLFNYSFPIYSDLYLSVYQYSAGDTPDDPTQLLTLGVDYTVQNVGAAAGGTITLTVGATVGDIITIVGTQPIARESVFQDLNPFTVALNQQLNQLTIMTQQNYTYWVNLTPHYNFDELVSAPSGANAGVRPFKLILPMLPDMHTWVGRGELGDIPDDITTMFIGGAGTGNVISTGDPMRQSLANWTGLGTQITDTNINLVGNYFTPTAGVAANSVTGFGDTWGAMHWPAHVTANRPLVAANGDTYYDTTTDQFFGFVAGVWVPFSSGGGTDAVIKLITTPIAHGLNAQNWVKIDTAAPQIYVRGIATGNPVVDADIIGVVIDVPSPTTFLLQQSGYNDTTFAGLTTGENYFLDTAVAGNMVPVDPTTNGQVSRPLFSADSATSGWVLPYRGAVVGGIVTTTSGGGNNPNVVAVNQTLHNLPLGDAIRADFTAGPQQNFVVADATTFANSLMIGFVIQVIDANNFIYQTGGYIEENLAGTIRGPIVDDAGNPLVPGTPYYLSTTPGKITAVEPTTPNYSRPVYMPTQTTADTGTNGGIIWEERSLLSGSTPPPVNPQLVQTNSDQPFQTTASGWVDTGICATITVTALQTVLIMANLNLASDGSNGVAYRVARNGTPIDLGAAAGSRTPATGGSMGGQFALDSGIGVFEIYEDNPGGAGTYTYCLEINRANSADASVNRGSTDSNSAGFFRSASTLVLMALN